MVTKNKRAIKQTPVVTAGIYSAGDAVGGLLTFAEILTKNGGGAVCTLVILDEAGQSDEFDLLLFSETFTATADNAAIAISDADAANCIGIINVLATAYADVGVATIATVKDINLCFKANTGVDTKSLFGQLVTRGTPTYVATTDITVTLVVDQD